MITPGTVLTLLPTGWHAGRPAPALDEVLLPTGGEWSLLEQDALADIDLAAAFPGSAGDPSAFDRGEPLDHLTPLRALVPSTCLATEHCFGFYDRDGSLLAELSGAALAALGAFRVPATPRSAFDHHRGVGANGLDGRRFAALVADLVGAGLLLPKADTGGGATRLANWQWEKARVLDDRLDAGAVARRADRDQRGISPRPAVIPVTQSIRLVQVGTGLLSPNLALGLIFAYADVHDGGSLKRLYDFEPMWMFRRRKIRKLLDEHGPSVFLFSNYVWSYAQNLATSALVKEMSPESLCVHGGPNTPKYEADTERFFAAYPHVDVTIRHEGEITTAEMLARLGGQIAGRGHDLSVLSSVEGLSYRTGPGAGAAGHVARTSDRPRMTELDVLPSPYTTGLFDPFAGIAEMAIVETNRGCPYGCTFCDWGSATLSRIRAFSTDRVLAEIEWVAKNQIHIIALGDANFGMFKRDVEITEFVAEMKRTYGYPQGFHASYAKNTAKHLKHIVGTLVDAEIMTEGNLALQTNDEVTLSIVKRKNIKASEYVEVGTKFRSANLPITTDLILGMPGATNESFAADLQFCIDREVLARISRLELLVNSPMNDPAYREQHRIEASVDPVLCTPTERALVVSTSTFDREDLALMTRWRDLFTLAENGGLLRHAALWAHHVSGLGEMAIYRRLEEAARTGPERYPLLAWACSHLIDVGSPPVSWRLFYDELGRFLVDVIGVPEGDQLDTVLAVQFLLAPQRGRRFPDNVALPHDYATWYRDVLMARQANGHEWPATVRSLGELEPATFTVDDPNGVCETLDGRMVNADASNGLWELESPVARAQLAPYRHVFDADGVPDITEAEAAAV